MPAAPSSEQPSKTPASPRPPPPPTSPICAPSPPHCFLPWPAPPKSKPGQASAPQLPTAFLSSDLYPPNRTTSLLRAITATASSSPLPPRTSWPNFSPASPLPSTSHPSLQIAQRPNPHYPSGRYSNAVEGESC